MNQAATSNAFGGSYLQVSGATESSCVFLGRRFAVGRGFSLSDAESLVGVRSTGQSDEASHVRLVLGANANYVGVWRDADKNTYIAEESGYIFQSSDPVAASDGKAQWQEAKLELAVRGIWGLDKNHIYVWGLNNGSGMIYQGAGEYWQPLPRPGIDVWTLHGNAPNALIAGGSLGRMARFDGKAWNLIISDVREDIVSIFMDETGTSWALTLRGRILEVTGNTVTQRGQIPGLQPGDARAIVKWKGLIWIAVGRKGLWRLTGQSVQCARPDLLALSLDARADLVVCSANQIASSSDGITFVGGGEGDLVSMRESAALGQWS